MKTSILVNTNDVEMLFFKKNSSIKESRKLKVVDSLDEKNLTLLVHQNNKKDNF